MVGDSGGIPFKAEKDGSAVTWQCSLEPQSLSPTTMWDGERDSDHAGDVEMALNMVLLLLLNWGHHFLILGALVVKLLFQALNSIAGHCAGVCVMPGWGLKQTMLSCCASRLLSNPGASLTEPLLNAAHHNVVSLSKTLPHLKLAHTFMINVDLQPGTTRDEILPKAPFDFFCFWSG